MKYVICVPDGCADQPVAALNGRTPLEAAEMPVLSELAARGTLGQAKVIPDGFPPGSDVGNMSIFGYDPALYHTGRAPIEAAALGLRLAEDEIAFRCNLVKVSDDAVPIMQDFAGGHPDTDQAAKVIAALNSHFNSYFGATGGLAGEGEGLGSTATGDSQLSSVTGDSQGSLTSPSVSFHPGVQYRHIMVAPREWENAICVPPHDLTDQPVALPSGPHSEHLRRLMHESQQILADFELAANQIWLWGQGRQPQMPSFSSRWGLSAGLVTAVDLVRGIGVLTGISVVEVEGATAWYDTNYEGKRDAVLQMLRDGTDLAVLHVEASDEAGHAGDVAEKINSLENWDSRIFAGLVEGLDEIGPWRMLVMPDHATPIELRTHTSDPVPYLLVDSQTRGSGGSYTEQGVAEAPVEDGHTLMAKLLAV